MCINIKMYEWSPAVVFHAQLTQQKEINLNYKVKPKKRSLPDVPRLPLLLLGSDPPHDELFNSALDAHPGVDLFC